MSLAGVNNSYSSFSPTTQQNNFRHYAPVDSDIEQDYTGTSSYSNDESNLEDNIGEGLGVVTDSEEENDSYPNAATSFTTEDEEDDDDEMECSSDSDSDITEDDQNNSTIQNHLFESENNFNVHRNGGSIINGNIINVSNPNNTNSSSNNNNILPPIQLLPVNPPPSMSTSTLNTSTTQSPNRSIGSDLLSFGGERLPTLSSMNTRNMPHRNPSPYNHGGGAYGVAPYNEGFSISQQQTVFRLPNGSHPSQTYSSSTESISQPPIPPPSSTTIPVVPQQKQAPLRFGFPDAHESRGHEVDGEDEDDGSSSTNSYDPTASRKRARSTSNDWVNTHPHQIQFGSLEPVNRGVISRQTMNHNSRASSTHSPILPVQNRSSIGNGIPIDYPQDITDVHPTPLSSSANFYYSPSRTNNYTPYSQHSSSTSASPSPSIQMRQQSQFFHMRTPQSNGAPRRNYQNSSHSLDSSSSTRRLSPDEHDNSYNANFASSGPDLSGVTYSETQERRNQHTHNNNNANSTNVSQGQGMNLPRWVANDTQRSGHNESLRPFIFDSYRRQVSTRTNIFPNSNNSFFGSLEPIRMHRNGEESDANIEISGSSDGDANIGNTTTVPPNLTNQWTRPVRRSNTTSRIRTVVPVSTSASTPATTHTSRNNSTDNNHSDEQLARRIQAREFSATHINEEHSVRLLPGTSRARSASRRDAGTNTSTSRSGSIRRDATTRVPMTPRIPRLPEILPHHDRHHSEERGNETRGRAHGSRSGQRSGRQNGHSLQRRLIQDYPLLGSFINSSEIEIEEFWDLLPDILGSGIAANPDNYLDEDEFDSSYEGLIRLSERIGDAKPKGVPEHIISNLPTKLYSLGRGKSLEERCTICLTEYVNNERLRDLPCSHDFHQECIDSWFKNSDKCPICRRSVTEE